jgi:hypothetical protein
MPAIDRCHDQIVHALEKAGWTVSDLPYAIRVPGKRYPLLADLQAQRGEDEIIIVEVKCLQSSPLEELYTAIGQYLVYQSALRRLSINYPVYLAVPMQAFHGIFEEIGLDVANQDEVYCCRY